MTAFHLLNGSIKRVPKIMIPQLYIQKCNYIDISQVKLQFVFKE